MDLTDLLKQTPEIAAMLLLAFWFLKALSRRDCVLKDVAAHCHEMVRDRTEAARDNTRMLGETCEVIREATALLRTMNGK